MRIGDYNEGMERIEPSKSEPGTVLVVGAGDIGQRLIALLAGHCPVVAVTRRHDQVPVLEALGARVLLADLDDPPSLARLAGVADAVIHLAPPPTQGEVDTRTLNVLRALTPCPISEGPSMVAQGSAGARQPGDGVPRLRRFVYVSTTGVYGDCGGAWVDETTPVAPQSDRARRRVDAERRLLEWGEARQIPVTVLRAPGIYAADRLPLERLRAGTPVLRTEDDVYTNHIHADDLARICAVALECTASGLFNACDDSQIRMGEYFDRVADAFGLARPPRVSRAEARTCIPAPLLSFMSESRRIANDRLKRELGIVLLYPTVDAGIAAAVRDRASRVG